VDKEKEEIRASMWKWGTLGGCRLVRSQNKKDTQTQWASFQSRHKNVQSQNSSLVEFQSFREKSIN
jgi:hypothetical protein